MQPVVFVFDRAQETENLAGAPDVGVGFAVNDFLDRARIVIVPNISPGAC
jgi:hypothetical protein